MSVVMGLRLDVDVDRFRQTLENRRDSLLEISGRGKEAGAIHHAFYANEDGTSVLVVDEWESADAFNSFFSASPDIGELMGEAGVSNEPRPEFWRKLDTPDAF